MTLKKKTVAPSLLSFPYNDHMDSLKIAVFLSTAPLNLLYLLHSYASIIRKDIGKRTHLGNTDVQFKIWILVHSDNWLFRPHFSDSVRDVMTKFIEYKAIYIDIYFPLIWFSSDGLCPGWGQLFFGLHVGDS